MNGPEHYAEAERLLALAEKEMGGYAATLDPQAEAYHLAQGTWAQQRAQVHATLALVAATANVSRGAEATSLVDAPGPWSNGRQGDGTTWQEILR